MLLCDASESASALGLGQDAVDFAARAVILDPFSERASRLLMSGHADVGELSLALREYERCRTLLAEELGIDPSPQTREVHLALLRSQRRAPRAAGTRPRRTRRSSRPDRGSRLGGPRCCVDPCAQASAGCWRSGRLHPAPAVRPGQALCADEAAGLTALPCVRARASVGSWLPDILLGGARVAREQLAQASRLADPAGDRLLIRRLALLNCLVAHDIGAADFPRQWAHAAPNCESESDVNWAWLMMRIAVERGDLETAQLARRLPLAAGAGPLAQQLHRLASGRACCAASGATDAGAMRSPDGAGDELERTDIPLLLPETLARLTALQAVTDVAGAERNLVRLDRGLNGQQGSPGRPTSG